MGACLLFIERSRRAPGPVAREGDRNNFHRASDDSEHPINAEFTQEERDEEANEDRRQPAPLIHDTHRSVRMRQVVTGWLRPIAAVFRQPFASRDLQRAHGKPSLAAASSGAFLGCRSVRRLNLSTVDDLRARLECLKLADQRPTAERGDHLGRRLMQKA